MRKVIFVSFLLILLGLSGAAYDTLTKLGIGVDPRDPSGRNRLFTINGRPVFLLGINYMGGLTLANDEESFDVRLKADLDYMQGHGMNWLRVWADHFGIFAGIAGEEEQEFSVVSFRDFQSVVPLYMNRLKRLIEECDRRGMIVDVSVNLHYQKFRAEAEKRLPYLSTLARELRDYRNVYFFIWNMKALDPSWAQQMREMSRAVRDQDPERLITTFGSSVLYLDVGGPIDEEYIGRWVEALGTMDIDFICIYTNNNAATLQNYLGVTREIGPLLAAYQRQMDRWWGRRVPIQLEEPVRIDYLRDEEQPSYPDFFRELSGAKWGGAAGWMYHNANRRSPTMVHLRPFRCLYMAEQSLLEQLAEQDRERWGFENEIRVWRDAASQCGGSDIDVAVLQPEFPEQVGHAIGEPDPMAGCLRLRANSQPGYLTTGAPVGGFTVGTYKATWRVRASPSPQGAALVLAVMDEAGRVVIQRKAFWRGSAETGWREFSLSFSVQVQGQRLGFATLWEPTPATAATGFELDSIRVRWPSVKNGEVQSATASPAGRLRRRR